MYPIPTCIIHNLPSRYFSLSSSISYCPLLLLMIPSPSSYFGKWISKRWILRSLSINVFLLILFNSALSYFAWQCSTQRLQELVQSPIQVSWAVGEFSWQISIQILNWVVRAKVKGLCRREMPSRWMPLVPQRLPILVFHPFCPMREW